MTWLSRDVVLFVGKELSSVNELYAVDTSQFPTVSAPVRVNSVPPASGYALSSNAQTLEAGRIAVSPDRTRVVFTGGSTTPLATRCTWSR